MADKRPADDETEVALEPPGDLGATAPTQVGGPQSSSPPPRAGADEPRFEPGEVLVDRYRILRLLGKGGMGEVFLADDLKLDQQVALKFLPAGVEHDEEKLKLLFDEIKVARKISHANSCRVFDLGEADGVHFLSMEYIDGEDLLSLLGRIGRLPWEKAVELGRQTCEGLAAAHDAGILHRDLKPANLMIDGHGKAKITDFGLAALSDTVSGAAIRSGTPAYMAPEQLAGTAISVQSDLYALGLLLYELFTGHRAFEASSLAELLELHKRAPKKPSAWVDGFDPAIEQVILQCLETDPQARPTSAREVSAGLAAGVGAAEGARIATLLLSDLVGSTGLVERAGDAASAEVSEKHNRLARDLVEKHGGREIDKTDGFLLLFDRPWQAVVYALDYHRALAELSETAGVEVESRVGIHLGEIVLRRNPPKDVARGAKPFEVEGLAKPTVARLMSVAGGRQTLMTQAAFDLARRSAVGSSEEAESLQWLAHGSYLFKGGEEPVEVFEVGVEGVSRLAAPEGSEKVTRLDDENTILGWRPAPGLEIPYRPNWVVEEKLGEGGFGEVWLGGHKKTGEHRVYKFCYEAQRLRSLQREITVFRLLKEELGQRDDIARILDWNLEEAPYFIEFDHIEGGDLVEWAEAQGGIGKLVLADRLEIVAQVATALGAAHSVGVLHKDIKPANVLMTRDADDSPRAVLTDFGVGLVTDRERLASKGITVLGLTEMHTTTGGTSTSGTQIYMAPELLAGKASTTQADIYSLGVMLYQVVVGELDRPMAQGWKRHVDDEILREDIAACVEGTPSRRPGNADEVAERLRTLEERRAQRKSEVEAARAAERAQRRRKALTTVAALSSVFLIVVSFLAIQAIRARETARREAVRARVALSVSAAREQKGDSTYQLALLRELEAQSPLSVRGWQALARESLRKPVAESVLRGDYVSSDRARVALISDQTVWVSNADGSGEPVVLAGHEDLVRNIVFSSDGSSIVTASDDKTARVWNADGSGKPVLLAGHEDWVMNAAFSPDDSRVVTASRDATARVWNADGSGEPLVLAGHEGWVMNAAFSPDGSRVVTASGDKTARVWNADGSGEPVVLAGHEDEVRSAAFCPDGSHVVTASQDKSARVWNTDGSGEPVVFVGHDDWVASAAFSPDGTRVITTSYDKSARLWNANGLGEPVVLGHRDEVLRAAFSPDGTRVVTGSGDGTARVWRVDALPEPVVLAGHQDTVGSAAFNPDGSRVVTASRDKTARVWNVDGSGEPVTLAGHDDRVAMAVFSPDGSRVVTASRDKAARVWNADGSGEPVVLAGHQDWVGSATFSPDGTRVVTASRDETARVWNANGSGEPVVLAGHDGTVSSAVFSPDGTRLVTASSDNTARVWNADGSGEPVVLAGHEDGLWSAAFDPDGTRIVTASFDKTARVWNADGSGEPVVLAGHEDALFIAAFSSDGSRVVTTSDDKTARVWNADGSGEPVVLGGHEDVVPSAAFSPDGTRVVTASYDKTARVWNADGSGEPVVLTGHEDWVSSAAFSSDGTRVVTASNDKTARVWNPDLLPLVWRATSFCLSAEDRVGFLDREVLAAQLDFERCKRMVECLRTQGDSAFEACYREFHRSQSAGD